MKSVLNKLILITFLFSIGCNDFLEENPRNVLSPEMFFNSDVEVKSAVNGLYVPFYTNALYKSYGLNQYYVYGTDEIEPSRIGLGPLSDINDYMINEGRDANARDAWKELYKIIQDANLLISKVTDNNKLSPAGRNQAIGEALFLRAFCFYHLTNIFGDVPYYKDNLPIDEVQSLRRSKKDFILTEITKNLQQSQELLPSTYTSNDLGRPTKWAAATLMVKIYLIQNKWKEGRDKAVEIIQSSPHKLLADYEKVFDPKNSYNEENIFQIDFVKDLNPGNTPDIFTPRIQDEPRNNADKKKLQSALQSRNEGFTGFGLGIPKCDFVDKFPMDDLRRPINIVQTYQGIPLKYPYMAKKWNLDQINSPRGNHGDNYVVFRLADVYLMAAESENELNGPNAAYQYINRVRERAYTPDKPLFGLTQQTFRQAIYDERKWELAGEGHRRMDLIRWGILLDVIKSARHCAYTPALNIKPHHILFPIPALEIQLNPALLETDPTNNGYR
jgi:hypothetical protein